jgi:hypothetical protein
MQVQEYCRNYLNVHSPNGVGTQSASTHESNSVFG